MSLMGLPQEPLPNRMFSLTLFLFAVHIQILICNDYNVSRAIEGPVYRIYYNVKGIYGIQHLLNYIIMLIVYKRETGHVKSGNTEWGFEKKWNILLLRFQ